MIEQDDFSPNPELEKKNNESEIFICTQCGECCHIRENKNIPPDQESNYFTYMYREFGILYFAKLSEITINVWPEEKEILEKDAEKKGVAISIRPKRGFYNQKEGSLVIIDYFMDHDVCPFFDAKKKRCGVYESRPAICRSYPLLTTTTLGKCKYKKTDVNAYDSEKPAALSLETRTSTIKNVIAELIAKGDIDITLPGEIVREKLKGSQIKELRLK